LNRFAGTKFLILGDMGITGKSILVTKKKNTSSANICSKKTEHLMYLNIHCSEKELEVIVNNVRGYKSHSK